MKELSSSEKALEYMQNFYDRDSKYFESKYHQREARQGYIELYNLDQKKGSDIWNHVFPKFLRKNRLKKEVFLKTRFRRPKNSDLKPTIKPEPQGAIIESHPIDVVYEEIQQQNSLLPNREKAIRHIRHVKALRETSTADSRRITRGMGLSQHLPKMS